MDIVFFGAGVSSEFGIPTTREMAFEFRDSLRPAISDDHIDKALCDRIFARLGEHSDFDIETLITVLEHIIDPSKTIQHVLTHPTIRYFPVMGASWDIITKGIIDQSGREKESANRLLGKVKGFIIEKCDMASLCSLYKSAIFRCTLWLFVIWQCACDIRAGFGSDEGWED
jgi:NAD-dependent SIR2 family protein deacetylase